MMTALTIVAFVAIFVGFATAFGCVWKAYRALVDFQQDAFAMRHRGTDLNYQISNASREMATAARGLREEMQLTNRKLEAIVSEMRRR